MHLSLASLSPPSYVSKRKAQPTTSLLSWPEPALNVQMIPLGKLPSSWWVLEFARPSTGAPQPRRYPFQCVAISQHIEHRCVGKVLKMIPTTSESRLRTRGCIVVLDGAVSPKGSYSTTPQRCSRGAGRRPWKRRGSRRTRA